MSWKEQNWDREHEALEQAVKAIRKAERTMLDRRMNRESKVERINSDLHRMRRALDECSAAMEWSEADMVGPSTWRTAA